MNAHHRLTSLRHRQQQFQQKLRTEIHNSQPDLEPMRFFETQNARIAQLIEEIEAKPAPQATERRTYQEAPRAFAQQASA